MNYTVDNRDGLSKSPFTCLAIFHMLIEYKRLEAEVIRNLSERKENEEAGQKPPIKERQTAD